MEYNGSCVSKTTKANNYSIYISKIWYLAFDLKRHEQESEDLSPTLVSEIPIF